MLLILLTTFTMKCIELVKIDKVTDLLSLSLSLSLSSPPPQLFGYLATFIWFASIWYAYKDTVWHKDRTGPLAKLYQQKDAEGQGETPESECKYTSTLLLLCMIVYCVVCIYMQFLNVATLYQSTSAHVLIWSTEYSLICIYLSFRLIDCVWG